MARIPTATLERYASVKRVTPCAEIGVDDYLFEVELHHGYQFTAGRMEGCRFAHFNTVADFRDAKPRKIT